MKQLDQYGLNEKQSYKFGFSTDIEVEKSEKVLSEEIIKFISNKKYWFSKIQQ